MTILIDVTQIICPAKNGGTHHLRPLGGTMFCAACGHSDKATREAQAAK